ncbi:EamA-like transporter family protein [anaerobic digester metagenome]|nr:DMT family transporter [Clostridiaceae bacterium HFYG-1003]
MKRKIPGEIILLLTAIIWGYGFVAVANSLDSLTPLQLLFLRFSIASLILAGVFHKRVPQLKKRTIHRGIILGTLFFIGFVLQTFGMKYTTPSKNAFLTGVNVIIVPIIAYFLYKRKLARQEVFGAVLSIIGIGLLTLRTDGQVNIGDLLTLGCAVAFAFHIFYTTLYMEKEHPADIAIIQTVTCMVLSGLAAAAEGTPFAPFNQSGLVSVLYLAVFSTSLTTLLQAYGQKYTSETRSAILLSTESLWGTLFSFLFLNETMTVRLIAGGLIIFSAILLAEIKPAKKPEPVQGNHA